MKPTPDAFAALRYRDFSIVTLNQFCLTLAILIQEIIVAYSLYKITKDPLTLGLIGLAEAIPFIDWTRRSHSLYCSFAMGWLFC